MCDHSHWYANIPCDSIASRRGYIFLTWNNVPKLLKQIHNLQVEFCPLEQERIRRDKIVLDGEEEDDRKLPKVE